MHRHFQRPPYAIVEGGDCTSCLQRIFLEGAPDAQQPLAAGQDAKAHDVPEEARARRARGGSPRPGGEGSTRGDPRVAHAVACESIQRSLPATPNVTSPSALWRGAFSQTLARPEPARRPLEGRSFARPPRSSRPPRRSGTPRCGYYILFYYVILYSIVLYHIM